jgi:hypothetical protein
VSDSLRDDGALLEEKVEAALARVLIGELDFLVLEPPSLTPEPPSPEKLILPLRVEVPGYVQFVVRGKRHKGDLYCEAASNKYLPGNNPLTKESEARLRELGWDEPDRKTSNWHRLVPRDAIDLRAEASRALATFRDVYGANVDTERTERRINLLAAGLSEAQADAVSALPPGPYTVVLTSVGSRVDRAALTDQLRDLGYDDPDLAIERATHIEAQIVAPGISERSAIALKKSLEASGARVRIQAGSLSKGRREAIPEHVRHEVWRRDQGRCVVCGSQEQLEFDHIIPISRGGSNTARNIELRCEPHNRSKGARI